MMTIIILTENKKNNTSGGKSSNTNLEQTDLSMQEFFFLIKVTNRLQSAM